MNTIQSLGSGVRGTDLPQSGTLSMVCTLLKGYLTVTGNAATLSLWEQQQHVKVKMGLFGTHRRNTLGWSKDSRVSGRGGQWEHPSADWIVIALYLAHIFKDFPRELPFSSGNMSQSFATWGYAEDRTSLVCGVLVTFFMNRFHCLPSRHCSSTVWNTP